MSQDLPTLVISIGGASAQKDTMGHTATVLFNLQPHSQGFSPPRIVAPRTLGSEKPWERG